jgi:Nuclease-related domain
VHRMENVDGRSGAGRAQQAEPRSPQLDRGTPGASAAREHERRRRSREARIRSRHPLIGGLLLAIAGAPAHETAWATGGHGEQSVARGLERRTASGAAILLHDRRMPGGYGNIDHLAVAPRGVFVIDTKAIRGRMRVSRPLFGRARLLVKGRDRTPLVNSLDRQVAAVRSALARNGRGDVPVQGAFCFTKAELPLFGSSEIRGHRLCSERSLSRRLNAKGALGREAIDALARSLASSFPPA